MSKGSDGKTSKISLCYTSGRVLDNFFKETLPNHDKYIYILNGHECSSTLKKILLEAIYLLLRNNLPTMKILLKPHLYHIFLFFCQWSIFVDAFLSLFGVAQRKIRPKTPDPVDRDVSSTYQGV